MEVGKYKGTIPIGGPLIEGIRIGETLAEEKYRAEAFGAIRRAAEVARDFDAIAYECDNDDPGAARFADMARATRRAIRAAIGSEKA